MTNSETGTHIIEQRIFANKVRKYTISKYDSLGEACASQD